MLQGGSFGTASGYTSLQYATRRATFALSGEGMKTDRYLDSPVEENFTNRGSGGGFRRVPTSTGPMRTARVSTSNGGEPDFWFQTSCYRNRRDSGRIERRRRRWVTSAINMCFLRECWRMSG